MNEVYQTINWQPSLKEKRTFGLILLIGFPIVGLIWLSMLRFFSGEWYPNVFYAFATIGVLFGGFVTFFPQWGRPIYIAWHCVTKTIEFVISYTLLAILYYCVITPIGIIKRGKKSNDFSKGFDKSATTYWKDISETKDLSQYYRQF